MKKKRKILLIAIIMFTCLISNIVYASETNVTLEKSKDKYTSNEEVKISVKINNITLEKGIETIIGKIVYNKDLYESCTIEERNNWESDFNEENGKIILQRNEAIRENHEAFVIKLKIKDNIENNDEISFTEINIADEETDIFPEDVKTTIIIEKAATGEGEATPGEDEGENEEQDKPSKDEGDKEGQETPGEDEGDKEGQETPGEDEGDKEGQETPSEDKESSENEGGKPSQSETDNNKSSSSETAKKDVAKGENKLPKAGISSAVGIMLAVTVYGAICFVKYNKYKQI